MAFLCKLAGHKWQGNRCARCGQVKEGTQTVRQAQAASKPAPTQAPRVQFPTLASTGYTSGGVFDVCGRSTQAGKAYVVPNQVFYASPKYKSFAASRGITPDGLRRMQAMDTSPGSAVCENCIHMFE